MTFKRKNSATNTTLGNNNVHDHGDDMSNIYDSPKVPPIPVVMTATGGATAASVSSELPTIHHHHQVHHDNNQG